MSAGRGWIGEPPPPSEHHCPGWLSEKGTVTGRSHFHPEVPTQDTEYGGKPGRRWT